MASRSLRELRQMGVAPRNTPLTTAPTVQRGMSGMVGRIAERVKNQPQAAPATQAQKQPRGMLGRAVSQVRAAAPQAQKQPMAPAVRTPRVRRGMY